MRKFFSLLVVVNLFAQGEPIVKPMKWVRAYETVAFNTADGDLDLTEYCPTGKLSKKGSPTYFIRTVSKDAGMVQTTDDDTLIIGKTEVTIKPGVNAYYNEFLSERGNIVREVSNSTTHFRIMQKDEPQPEKTEIVLFSIGRTLDAAVAFDAAANSGDLSNTTSGSWSHTIGAGLDKYIVAGLSGWDGDAFDAVAFTYNGEALTELGGEQAAGNQAILYGRATTAAAGAHTVAYSNVPAGIGELGGGSMSFEGVDGTDPEGTPTSAQAATTNISMTTGDMGVDILYDGEDPEAVAGTGQTARVNQNTNTIKHHMMSHEAGNGTVTMSWTEASDVAIAAIPLLQSAGGAAAPTPSPQRIRTWMRR